MANSARMKCLSAFFAFFLIWTAPLRAHSETTVVFAAASLRGVLEDIAESSETEVVFSFGGSGSIARQISWGAPADLVILASSDWMQWLGTSSVIDMEKTVVVAQNRLVVIGAKDERLIKDESQLIERLGADRLAIGQRDAVPAGTYAREWLQNVRLWDEISPQLAETDSVRAALALVARGETPFGVVYATDARSEPAVRLVFDVPPSEHSQITYPAAALSDKGHRFLDHLQSQIAAQIWQSHGFLEPVQ